MFGVVLRELGNLNTALLRKASEVSVLGLVLCQVCVDHPDNDIFMSVLHSSVCLLLRSVRVGLHGYERRGDLAPPVQVIQDHLQNLGAIR